MPSAPEFIDCKCLVGRVEVKWQVDVQHLSHADSHVGVTAEIKVNLNGIGKSNHKGVGGVKGGYIGVSPVCNIADYVGYQDLFGKTQGESIQTLCKVVPVKALFRRVAKLRHKLIVGNNGTCNQLGEEGYEAGVVDKVGR